MAHTFETFAGLPLPLRITPPAPFSDDDLMRFSAEHELYPVERDANGDILVMSPTGRESSERNVDIVFELELWNRQTGRHGVVTESNGGYKLPDTSVRAPDAAWTSHLRLERLNAAQLQGFAPVCPEFVIELRSKTDRMRDLHAKMQMWMRNGVELAWLIDPMERAVTIYRAGREPEYLDKISQVAGDGPVVGFVLPLDRIFND